MVFILAYKRFQVNFGSSRQEGSEEKAITHIGEADQHSKMSFTPVILAFKDITYDVQLPSKEWRRLLRGICGIASPGRLTALMGISGSGKTTLMDVLLGMKSSGKTHGDIYVNGHPKDDKLFRRIAGYVEQFDHHMPYCTVAESLQYAAELRLPSSTSSAEKSQFIEEVLQLMELSRLRDNIVGIPGENDGGLAPGERKRLTIAVELVANPSLIFLDEPTTGLDSRAAMSVMRVIKRIVNTGRTVVCTVHQPSYQLFSLFDDIILLQRGGHEVYAGPIGDEGKDLISYFESAGVSEPSKDANPADWVLSVLLENADTTETGEASNTSGQSSVDFAEIYNGSNLKVTNDEAVEHNCSTQGENPLKDFAGEYARRYGEQFIVILKRTAVNYWRNVSFNWVRIFSLALLSLAFGVLFYDIVEDANDEAGVLSFSSLIFICVAFGSMTNYSAVLPVIAKERAIYYRERSSKMYSSTVYSLSLTLMEIPYLTVITLTFGTIYYFMVRGLVICLSCC